jgi:protoporphyrinogen/coproporphyrinogen III oxidase
MGLPMKRIAIVGGGISGVTAAWQLAQERKSGRDAEFVLYEASHRLGGIVETERRDGFVIECGPDSWVAEKPWARELAVELGLEAELIASNDHARRTYLLRESGLVPMPDGMRMIVPTQLDAITASPLFTAEARAAYAREPQRAGELKAAALPPDQDESVASFVRRHFGDEVTRTLAGPLLAGVFGGDVEKLSVRAVMAPFVKMEREHGSLIAALQSQAGKAAGKPAAPIFATLASGLGTFIERMSAELPGNALRLATPVEGIARAEEKWRVDAGGDSEEFDALILAAPPHVTRGLLEPVDAGLAALLAMEATSAIVVALAFDREAAQSIALPQGFGYLVPPQSGDEDALLACTFVQQKFSQRAPAGCVLLRAFFGGEVAQRWMAHPDNVLVEKARAQLELALGPLPGAAFSLVRRWPCSLPQYQVGHLDRMRQLEARVAKMPALALIGNAYHGVGLPDRIREARHAVGELLR